MVSKEVLTTFLTWVEHVEALGFTQGDIDKLADEYLEVQGVTPPVSLPKPKHGIKYESTAYYGNRRVTCYCGYQGAPKDFDHHLDDMSGPTISTYCPPPDKEHTIRGDSIGMGLHERWYCSCGMIFPDRTGAEFHREYANGSY